MALDRINNTRFHSDKQQSNNSSKELLEFCYANKSLVFSGRNGSKDWLKIISFKQLIRDGEVLTPNQKSCIEAIYEKIWSKAGYPACSTKHDLKRRLI